MKMSPERFAQLVSDLRTVVDYHGPATVRQWLRSNKVNCLFALWHGILFDRMNPDTHPAFTQRKRDRILPFAGYDYDPYAGDLNDEHIYTALRRAAKSLGLLEE